MSKAKPKLASIDRQVTFGDSVYTLRYSLKAFAALQDYFKLDSIQAVAERLAQGGSLSVNDLVAMFHAGLCSHHPEMSRSHVLDLLDEAGPLAAKEKIEDAFAAGLADNEGGAAGADGQATPSS